ncbi:NAD-dependent epimerase/dehydratase family protein [Paenisporosarcina sp. TG20]|uniref:NAD-dependent epimerase/dehydratase family protein n=1 Tax=Paenisporosarcina sp. TG20 TaxID=1211706 RepID=UPI0002E5BA09|nr:NAD-dependent epimerase/dehydratase family protein [Paenisporosarcina sp. TG20]
MKVLITGGAGFIGSHVVEECLANNYEVVVIDNLSTGKSENILSICKNYTLDINDDSLKHVFEVEKPDHVIHLAAQASVMKSIEDPISDGVTNVIGTLRLLEYARIYRIKKFVMASSAAVYGNPDTLPVDEKFPLNPLSFYSLSKWSGERYVQLYESLYGLSTCILRFSNVYGPRQNPLGEAGVVSIFINQLLNREKLVIYGGQQTRDFVYVKDVAKACRTAIESSKSGIFNISSNSETTIDELFSTTSLLAGITSKPQKYPMRIGEIEKSVLGNEKASKELNWQASHSLQEGLKETISTFHQLTKL